MNPDSKPDDSAAFATASGRFNLTVSAAVKHKGGLSDGASFYISCNHALGAGSHSVDVSGATGRPEVERPNGRKQPARVKSHGKPESIRRPRGEPRPAWSRLHCLKPNPERMINDPAATSVLRRRVSGADPKRPMVGKTARYSDRGDEPGSRDEWAT